jgi:hypothetical protein
MMTFNPNLPADYSALSSAEMRNQLNALKALVDGMQLQLAPLVPALSRSVAGVWTLTYGGSVHDYWQIWARSSGNPAWSATGEINNNDFPATDSTMAPDGESWWQVKICGEDGDGKQATPFSNIISFGPVPG